MNRIRFAIFRACAGVCLFLAGGSLGFAVGVLPSGLRTVALSGTSAPGAGSGVTYRTLYDADNQTTATPVVNGSGQVAFIPQLSSFATQNGFNQYDNAVYSEGGGSLALIARTRAQSPGTARNILYGSFVGNLHLNDSGAVTYLSFLTGLTSIDEGIFSNRSGTNSLIARYSQQALGYPSGVTYISLFEPAFNNSGNIAFGAYPTVNGPQFNPPGAYYADVGGSGMQLIARTGDPAPGIPGTNYGTIGSGEILLNNAGELFFAAGVGDTNTFGFWSKKPGAPATLIIRDGDPAPGLPGLTCPSFSYWAPGGTDSFLFHGTLQGPLVTANNNDAMFYLVNGQLHLLAREGQQAFGLSTGVVFGDPSPSVTPLEAFLAGRTNAKGDVLFRSQVRGPQVVDGVNDSGLWEGNAASGFHLVAQRGTSIGASPGGSMDIIQDTALNDLGQIAYLAGFNNPLGYYTAIMATNLNGNLIEIARTGQQIDVDNGPGVDLRTIASFCDHRDFFNNDENIFSMGSSGHIVFRVQFTDGSDAILTSSAVAVPEPGAVALCVLAIGTRAFTRRRCRV
jgi:hypothetical protein